MRNTFTLLLLLFISDAVFAQNKKSSISLSGYQRSCMGGSVNNTAEKLISRVPVAPVFINPKRISPALRLRCYSEMNRTEPLIIMDGSIVEYSVLSGLDPSNMEDITVLNANKAIPIFGPQGTAGVIIIISKKAKESFQVHDRLDGSVIPGATITFISSDRRDTLMYVADSLGKVGLKELNKRESYTVRVSSSGYITYTGLLSDQVTGEIKLERDFKTGPDVVVSSFHAIGCCRGCGGGHQLAGQDCGIQVALIRDTKSNDSLVQPVAVGFRVYPNPVHRGQEINLRLLQGYFPEGSIQVLSLDGKKLFSVPVNAGKKQGQVLIPTEQRWVAGIYILQLVYANGRVGASEKVIIQ